MTIIPDEFKDAMVALHGDKGRIWLDRLPSILADCATKWGLTIGEPFSLSYHYVAAAIDSDGTPVVIKACSPSGEFAHELEALRLFDGHGMARLLNCDMENEVMLLERLLPGTILKVVEDDEQATSIAASVMRKMWRPAPERHSFPTVADWGKGFERLRKYYNGGCGPFPCELLEEAETLFHELTSSMAEPALLHGDLHHDNILAAQREPWLAIDPKGLIGEPVYETGAWLRNPIDQLLRWPHPEHILARRIDQFAEELGMDRARIRGWGLSQAILSVWWNVEDFGRVWQDGITCAVLLAAIKV